MVRASRIGPLYWPCDSCRRNIYAGQPSVTITLSWETERPTHLCGNCWHTFVWKAAEAMVGLGWVDRDKVLGSPE